MGSEGARRATIRRNPAPPILNRPEAPARGEGNDRERRAAAGEALARRYSPRGMEASDLEEIDLFRAVRGCGARSLLLGRRALVIATKSWAMRAKDIADIQLLEALRRPR